jgi:hypothetical protein
MENLLRFTHVTVAMSTNKRRQCSSAHEPTSVFQLRSDKGKMAEMTVWSDWEEKINKKIFIASRCELLLSFMTQLITIH